MTDKDKAAKAMSEAGLRLDQESIGYEIWRKSGNPDSFIAFCLFANSVAIGRAGEKSGAGLRLSPRTLRAIADYEEAFRRQREGSEEEGE